MTISISDETEALLREKATREGRDVNSMADAILADALTWESRERTETIEAVRLADVAAEEGRERPLSEFLAEQRAKYGVANLGARPQPGDVTDEQG